jgi:hypothetical protein
MSSIIASNHDIMIFETNTNQTFNHHGQLPLPHKLDNVFHVNRSKQNSWDLDSCCVLNTRPYSQDLWEPEPQKPI